MEPRPATPHVPINMQNKNLIIFIALAALIIGGWLWLQHIMPPPPTPTKKKDDAVAKVDDKKDKQDIKDKDKEKEKDNEKAKDKPPPVEPPQHVAAVDDVTIGGDGDTGYHISAVLTSKGGGVRRLTLNRFKAENWLGKPYPDGRNLQLIQDDPIQPSFRLYHYPDGNAEVAPVFGMGDENWKLEYQKKDDDGNVNEVAYSTRVPGAPHLEITRVYRLEVGAYHLGLTLLIRDTRKEGAPTPFRYQLTGGQGLPIDGEWYTSIYRNAVIAQVDGNSVYRDLEGADRISHRWGGEKVPLGNRGNSFVQYAGVMNQYFASAIVPDDVQPDAERGGGDFKNLIAWARPTNESTEIKGVIQKIDAAKNEILFQEIGKKVPETYHMLARTSEHLKEIDLQAGDKAVLSWYETPGGMKVASYIRPGLALRPSFDDITVRVNSEQLQLKPGQTVAHAYLLYHGPVKTRLLSHLRAKEAVSIDFVDRYSDTLHLRTLTDYASPGVMGKISQTIFLTDIIILVTKVMHTLLWLLSYIAPSGLCVILLTVIVRGLMFPISRRQALFSIRMQELAPELKKLQEKYKNDPQAKTQAVMELYRKHKIHPLGSCLPLFLQMPIFMGLYFALQESIQFRLAPFLWIENLAAPDMLIWWTQSIPFLSDPDSMGGVLYLGPYLNLLPIIAVVFMVIQQKLMTPPATDEQQEQQQKMMRWMSIFFGVLFYKVAAGLCIYFISSSLWGLAERKLLPRKKTAPQPPGEPNGVLPGGGQGGPRGGKRGGRRDPKKPEGDPTAIQKLKGWWSEVLKQAQKK